MQTLFTIFSRNQRIDWHGAVDKKAIVTRQAEFIHAKHAMKRLVACAALLVSPGWPVFSETPPAESNRHKLGLPIHSPIAVIPTAANTRGRFGAHFKTRVTIDNSTPHDFPLTNILFGPQGIVDQQTYQIKGNTYYESDNLLEQVFEYSGNGAVVLLADLNLDINDPGSLDPDRFVNSPYKFSITAEVYTDSPNGRFSTTVVNGIVPLADERTSASHVGITVNENQRVNIGAFNLSENSNTIRAEVWESSSRSLLEVIEFQMRPFSWQQKPINVSVDPGFIRWEIEGGLAYLWAVTVDNRSNDGSLVWAATPPD